MPRPNVRQMPDYVTKTEAGPLAPWTQYPKDPVHAARLRGTEDRKQAAWQDKAKRQTVAMEREQETVERTARRHDPDRKGSFYPYMAAAGHVVTPGPGGGILLARPVSATADKRHEARLRGNASRAWQQKAQGK